VLDYKNVGSLIMKNGIFDGNTLIIEYENEKKYIFQNGTVVGKLDAFGEKIEGQFVGYSPTQEKIIHGKVFLKIER
jgi:hypothetical protein